MNIESYLSSFLTYQQKFHLIKQLQRNLVFSKKSNFWFHFRKFSFLFYRNFHPFLKERNLYILFLSLDAQKFETFCICLETFLNLEQFWNQSETPPHNLFDETINVFWITLVHSLSIEQLFAVHIVSIYLFMLRKIIRCKKIIHWQALHLQKCRNQRCQIFFTTHDFLQSTRLLFSNNLILCGLCSKIRQFCTEGKIFMQFWSQFSSECLKMCGMVLVFKLVISITNGGNNFFYEQVFSV
eukprot:TRINITY_DN7282_c0_g1_i11.p1 TRINITY_DN7282_c0_g1~~TRINITY_DN7282_c0_g1_i11.p1  ORF type:complete len:240 (+),score=-20.21 TRINITY_DN7282_c0_g1_i11:80-799(+)